MEENNGHIDVSNDPGFQATNKLARTPQMTRKVIAVPEEFSNENNFVHDNGLNEASGEVNDPQNEVNSEEDFKENNVENPGSDESLPEEPNDLGLEMENRFHQK